jgi:adenylate cyclase
MPPKKQAKLLTRLRWLLLLALAAVWCLLDHRGTLTFLENKSVDWRFQYRGELVPPVRIVYVNIDTLSLAAVGNMPWTRSIYSKVAAALVEEAGVKAVAFDLVFSDLGVAESADRSRLARGNAEFGRYLMKQPPVVLAAAYGGWRFLDVNRQLKERHLPILKTETRRMEEIEPPELPAFETSPDPDKSRPFTPPVAIGLIDTLGGGTRVVPAWAPNNTSIPYHHMAVQLARLYWGLPREALRVREGRLEFVRPDGSVQRAVPLRDGQMIEVNWFNRWHSPHVAHIEFASVYDEALGLEASDPAEVEAAKRFFAQPGFKDAVVLIGPVDPILQDIAPTPLDEHPVPKVGLHGNLLSSIIAGVFLERIPAWANHLMVLVLALAVATLAVVGGARAVVAKVTAGLLFAGYIGLIFWLFERHHLVLPFTAPVGAVLTASLAGLVWQVVEEQKAKGRIKGMFGTYVSPQLVERMVDSGEEPQLGGHDAEITAYFSDIQSFSSFSEQLGSAPLVELMNEYLTACTDIVQAQGGTLDKYIGDAVVAMFGAPIALPDHAYRACVATQLLHRQLGDLRAKWKLQGGKWPEIVWNMQSRIGLNTGVCMIGNMGSRTRFNYTMMGDNVNLAARMESGAKRWGAYTMCTEATKLACERHGGQRVLFRRLGRIVVMGRAQPVPIFEIVGLAEWLAQEARECVGLFEQGLDRYHARDWIRARALFEQSAALEANQPGRTPGVSTNPSLVYLGLAERYQIEAPAGDWDGVYVMTEK